MENKKYGLIGYPLGHSLSPQIHARLFELAGISGAQYEKIEIPPEKLDGSFDTLRTLAGFNITIPHKINIIPMCDRLDATAKRYNSVNCIDCKDGATGYNTDCIGFISSVKSLGASLDGKVLLLGCGGVGRMMAVETVLTGGSITLSVRKEDMDIAAALCDELNALKSGSADYCLLCDAHGKYDLCVNATPVGMYPNSDFSPLDDETLSALDIGYLFDAIFNPRETLLMKKLNARGAKVMGGMDMLVRQAVAAHTIWDGSEYDEKDIVKIVEDMKELV